MRIKSTVVVRAPRATVWETITDPTAYLDFMSGITRWELDDGAEGNLELGSRIRMLIRVGAAQVGGLIEVVEFKPCSDLAWSSVTGVDQRGRWRLRDAGEGLTRVELRFSYGVAGAGIPGLIAERVGAPILNRRLKQSLLGLKRRTERERREAAAAAPRRERATV
jgi:uncharacterized membrane protein